MRTYLCRVDGLNGCQETEIYAESPGRARYLYRGEMEEAGYDIEWIDIRVRVALRKGKR